MRRITIRVSDALHDALVNLAEQEKRSLNAQLELILEQAVKQSTKSKRNQESEDQR